MGAVQLVEFSAAAGVVYKTLSYVKKVSSSVFAYELWIMSKTNARKNLKFVQGVAYSFVEFITVSIFKNYC